MRDAANSQLGTQEAQYVAIIDWWVKSKKEFFLELIEKEDPSCHSSLRGEIVGSVILSKCAWREMFFRDISRDSLADFMWKNLCGNEALTAAHCSDTYNLVGADHLDLEVFGRVGLLAQVWIAKNRKMITKNQKCLKVVKKVHES